MYRILFLFLLSIIFISVSFNFGIFWDNTTFVSKMGLALYQNGIFNWMSIIPEFDPGHPPFIATYLAWFWSIFEKSLWVSHLVMLPFVFGFLVQLFKFIEFFVKNNYLKIFAFILVLIDPTLLAQLVNINPEVPLLFFFFLALNGLLYENNIMKVVGLAFLGLVSYRGMMLGVGVFTIDIILYVLHSNKSFIKFFNKQNIIIYGISALPALSYIIWRLVMKGWLISNPLEPWGNATDYSSNSGFLWNFLRNFAVLIHRYIDFGRISFWIVLIVLFFILKKHKSEKKIISLIVIAICSVFVIIITSLVLNNPMGHRYFIVSYLVIALLTFKLLQYVKYKKIVYSILIISLISSNFIVYPDHISQGWDASLAHLHYWDLRKSALIYAEENEIKISNTASFFPNCTSIDVVELNGDKRSFKTFTGNEEYVLYSNVYNLNDENLEVLKYKYIKVKTFESFNVRVEILELKK